MTTTTPDMHEDSSRSTGPPVGQSEVGEASGATRPVGTDPTGGAGPGPGTGALLPPLARWAKDRGVVAAIVVGFVVGVGWGIVARVWMRLVSEHPEFSWSGTGYIVLAPALIGAVVALAHVAMVRHWRAALLLRVPALLVHVLLGVGAGALLGPTIMFGSVALARNRFGLAVRLGLALLVLALGVPVGVGDGGSAMGAGMIAAAVVVVVMLVSGWRTRVVLGTVAMVGALGVSISVLVSDIPLGRGMLGALLFLPLVAIPTLSAASVLQPDVGDRA